MAPTTTEDAAVAMTEAMMMAVVAKDATRPVQQLPAREQNANKPTTISRAVRMRAMMYTTSVHFATVAYVFREPVTSLGSVAFVPETELAFSLIAVTFP